MIKVWVNTKNIAFTLRKVYVIRYMRNLLITVLSNIKHLVKSVYNLTEVTSGPKKLISISFTKLIKKVEAVTDVFDEFNIV